MADPHAVLAPLIEPPLPPAEAAMAASWPWLAAAAAVTLAAALAWHRWQRNAVPRALHRIERLSDPVAAANQLAQLVRQRGAAAPLPWLQALERLRFGPADGGRGATLQRLCAEARGFLRAR